MSPQKCTRLGLLDEQRVRLGDDTSGGAGSAGSVEQRYRDGAGLVHGKPVDLDGEPAGREGDAVRQALDRAGRLQPERRVAAIGRVAPVVLALQLQRERLAGPPPRRQHGDVALRRPGHDGDGIGWAGAAGS